MPVEVTGKLIEDKVKYQGDTATIALPPVDVAKIKVGDDVLIRMKVDNYGLKLLPDRNKIKMQNFDSADIVYVFPAQAKQEMNSTAYCWYCKKNIKCDCMDATCSVCGRPYAKDRCGEFGFTADGKAKQEPKKGILEDERHEFYRLWHTYHAKNKIPYSHDEKEKMFNSIAEIFMRADKPQAPSKAELPTRLRFDEDTDDSTKIEFMKDAINDLIRWAKARNIVGRRIMAEEYLQMSRICKLCKQGKHDKICENCVHYWHESEGVR